MIQGRDLPFDVIDKILLRMRIAVSGTFSMILGKTDSILATEDVFIAYRMINSYILIEKAEIIALTMLFEHLMTVFYCTNPFQP